jgi:hypothetical protein
MTQSQNAKIFVTTKTYPSISRRYIETVCTAGVLLDDQDKPLRWIRLYPIPYRYLEKDRQFPRYSMIEVETERNTRDSRFESYRLKSESINVLLTIDTKNNWEKRKKLILPLQRESIAEIKANGESLGIIRPHRIIRAFHTQAPREWNDSKKSVLDQGDLFIEKKDLEKIPYNFKYEFTSLVDGIEKTHKLSIIDWEIPQLYRKCLISAQGSVEQKEEAAIQKVLDKLNEFSSQKDLYFMVGNQQAHPNSFMIIGLFYPPLVDEVQLRLM